MKCRRKRFYFFAGEYEYDLEFLFCFNDKKKLTIESFCIIYKTKDI